MASNDSHPADDMAKAFMGLFNGDNIKDAMRGAWDRMTASNKPTSSTDSTVQQINRQMNDKGVQDANATFTKSALDDAAAARIRAKAGKMAK